MAKATGKKDGGEELVLYVKQADRDYARYCTGYKSNGQTRRTACLPAASLIVCRFQPLRFLPGITGRSREDSDRR